jgi:HEAT repeat protein
LSTDPDPLVRGQAFLALGESHDPQVAPDLIKGLKDKNTNVRRDAAAAALNIQSETLVPPLLALLKNDESAQVKLNCAKALKLYKGAKAADVERGLIGALDDHDVAVAEYAYLSLMDVTGKDFGRDPKPWLEWYQLTNKT